MRHAVAVNLRALRSSWKLTQEALANRFGVQRSWVGDLEREQRNLTFRSIEEFADKLGISVFYLLRPVTPVDFTALPAVPGQPAPDEGDDATGSVSGA